MVLINRIAQSLICDNCRSDWVRTNGIDLIIANRVSGIEAIYANTPWRKSVHGKRLKRLGGTNDGSKTHKFHGVASKVTVLPISLIFPDDG